MPTFFTKKWYPVNIIILVLSILLITVLIWGGVTNWKFIPSKMPSGPCMCNITCKGVCSLISGLGDCVPSTSACTDAGQLVDTQCKQIPGGEGSSCTSSCDHSQCGPSPPKPAPSPPKPAPSPPKPAPSPPKQTVTFTVKKLPGTSFFAFYNYHNSLKTLGTSNPNPANFKLSLSKKTVLLTVLYFFIDQTTPMQIPKVQLEFAEPIITAPPFAWVTTIHITIGSQKFQSDANFFSNEGFGTDYGTIFNFPLPWTNLSLIDSNGKGVPIKISITQQKQI